MSGEGQLSLGAAVSDSGPYTMKERTLAGTIAGFALPGRGSFEKLKKPEQERCLEAARLALEHAGAKVS